MAITAEVEILCQQLKGKGMYTVPPTLPTTSDSKPGNNVHFRPIDPAQKSSVQTMDKSLLNSSLNLMIHLDHSHPVATDKFQVDKQHSKVLRMKVATCSAYALHKPNSCESTHGSTTRSDSA